MSNFNFKEITETQQKPRFTPGIYENVIVMGVREGETVNGKKVINVSFTGENGETFEASWSMEGKAPQYTMKKLKHMLTKYHNEDSVNEMTTVAQINKALTGKTFRIKFIGQEYINKEGVLRVKTDIGMPNFCEAMKVPKSGSGLTYDPTNKYDLIRLPMDQLPTANDLERANTTGDLPF